jgi:hypothetical protein
LLPADLDAQDIEVSAGYRYSLFVAPFSSGTVKVEAVCSDPTPTEYKISLLAADVTSAGKIVEFVAPTDTVRITPSAAVTVYVELQAILAVANATDTYV